MSESIPNQTVQVANFARSMPHCEAEVNFAEGEPAVVDRVGYNEIGGPLDQLAIQAALSLARR